MPSVARIAALVACGLLIGVGATACGSSATRATGFCGAIRQADPAFNSLVGADAPQALAAFDRIASRAPAAVAADLHTVSNFQRVLRTDPAQIAKHVSRFKAYSVAIKRVDAYLHDTCGVKIPPFGKLF